MSLTERNPTMVAECGCPYDPEYDEGHVGWHLATHHRERAWRVSHIADPSGTPAMVTLMLRASGGVTLESEVELYKDDARALAEQLLAAADRVPAPTRFR